MPQDVWLVQENCASVTACMYSYLLMAAMNLFIPPSYYFFKFAFLSYVYKILIKTSLCYAGSIIFFLLHCQLNIHSMSDSL